MNEANQNRMRAAPAAAPSTADELAKLQKLHTAGVLSDAEFQAQKTRLLGSP